jgi:hypothetical protein
MHGIQEDTPASRAQFGCAGAEPPARIRTTGICSMELPEMAQALAVPFLGLEPAIAGQAGRAGVLVGDDEDGLVLDAFVQGDQLHPVLLS